jgi:hypothetical protein
MMIFLFIMLILTSLVAILASVLLMQSQKTANELAMRLLDSIEDRQELLRRLNFSQELQDEIASAPCPECEARSEKDTALAAAIKRGECVTCGHTPCMCDQQ